MLLESVKDVRTRELGPEHPHTLASMNNLAIVMRDMGHMAEAHALSAQVLPMFTRALGHEHPDTLTHTVTFNQGK
jgi:hypothetical protein